MKKFTKHHILPWKSIKSEPPDKGRTADPATESIKRWKNNSSTLEPGTLPVEYKEALINAIAFIDMTYTTYVGVLDYLQGEGKLSVALVKVRERKYKKQRDKMLSTVIKDIFGLNRFYEQTKKELRKAVNYAEQKTGHVNA